ncbi:MAG: hypothetical protein IPF52_07585 [Saprospiraceae bacterium]|nr:hypothetical protein [Saprospiraceae bacterium]
MRIFYLIIFICFSVLVSGQQILYSEGKQKIQLYENGVYSLVTDVDTVMVHLIRPNVSDSIGYYLVFSKIIEAEYFVANYLLHKEQDVTNLSLKIAKEENNLNHISDNKKKLKDLRIKIKDNEDLYSNALHYKTLADHIVVNDSITSHKKWERLKKYVDSKDYLLKIIQNRSLMPPAETNVTLDITGKTDVLDKPEIKKIILESNKNCSVTEIVKSKTIELQNDFAPFFTYTPERLKSYLKNENLLKGKIRLRQINNQYYLDLTLILNSKDAAKSYGNIPENNMFRIEFINGIRLNFKNLKNSGGSIEEYSGRVIYNLTFNVGKEMLNLIDKVPIDHVGLMWSTGFEKYNIYEIDVLMNQYKCIKSLNRQK